MNALCKPCPFCGGTCSMDIDRAPAYCIVCDECGAEGPQGTPEQAVADWNRRVQP